MSELANLLFFSAFSLSLSLFARRIMPTAIPDLSGESGTDSEGEGITLKVNEKFASRFEAQEQKREFAYLQSKGLLEVRIRRLFRRR